MFNSILPELGVKVRFADPLLPESFVKQINENTRLVYSEVIGNPVLDVANLKILSAIAKKHNLPFAVDSTFATPYLIRPVEHGADIVIHSLTKWLGGHGTGIGGIVVDSCKFNWKDKKFHLYNEPDGSYHNLRFSSELGELNPLAFILRMRLIPLRNLGACISPDNAWMFLQGVETLPLRMQRHCDNALKTAEYLKSDSRVSWIRYPGLKDDPSYGNAKGQFDNGFGGMVVFGIKGGREAGENFINKLKLFSHLANVGDAKSLAIHPASTTHSQLSEEELKTAGITQDMVRLSVGIENIEDIIDDIDNALNA
jgi:O-acetylhomoserine (thiol)-lyase